MSNKAELEWPDWLPDCLDIAGYDTGLVEWLFEVFSAEFGPPTRCQFAGRPVWFDGRKRGDPHPEGLWHLITREDHQIRERLVDLERARHLPWCAAVIQNAEEPEVTCWHLRHERDNTIRAALWLRDWDYVVFLARKERPKGVIYDLVTAYLVDYGRKRDQLEKSYENRLELVEPDWEA